METMQGFELWLIRQSRKPATIEKHLERLRYLSRCIEVTPENFERFLLDKKKAGLRNKTLNSFIDTMRVWAKYKGMDFKPQYFKPEACIKEILSDEEIEQIINLPKPNNSRIYEMWTMFFKVVAYSGMRPNEAAKLQINDIQNGFYTIRDSKINESRLVPISPAVKEDLEKYIAKLPRQNLFETQDKMPVRYESWCHQFKARLKRAGIKRKVSLYSFRYSFITRLLNENENVFRVQRIVGHHNFETTKHYYKYANKDLTESIKHDPLARTKLSPSDVLDFVEKSIRGLGLERLQQVKYDLRRSGDYIHLKVGLTALSGLFLLPIST